MNDQQQSRADALTDDQRQALGESISEYFGKLDSDEGIRAPEGRILRAFDYCDSRNVDDLIDRAIVPALSISANETGAEGATWYDRWQAECTRDHGEYDENAPIADRLRWWVPKSARHGTILLEDDLREAADELSRSPAMAAEAQTDWRELSRRLYVELFHCDQQMRSTRDEDGEPHWTQSTAVRDVLADAKAALDLPIGTLGALFAIQRGFGAQAAMAAVAPADERAAGMPDEVRDSMMDSQYLAGVTAGWNAANADDPNAALKKIHDAYSGYLNPLRDWQKAGRPGAPATPATADERAECIAWANANGFTKYHESMCAAWEERARRAAASAAPADDARECLMDVVSHHENIVAGFAAQRLAAEEAQDNDTAGYWKREIDVAHRMKAQAERALAAASPAAERMTAALQALSADVHTLGDGWANDEAMIGLAKKYLRVEPKPASPELSLWRDFVLLAITDAAPQPAQAASPAAEAVAWVRKHPDTGELSGDWLWNDAIEQCRKDSGVWFPLGFLGARPALPEEPAAIHQVIHQVWVEETSSWADVTPAYYAERQPSNRRRVYYAPQPAQADAPAHATECPHCDGEGVIEADSGASPCACAQDAQEGMPTFGARRTQADAPAEAREPNQIYVEVRQCDRCDHIGINDGHATDAACGYPCGWSGPSPVEDKCPGCGHENVMSVACPKCSGHYSLLANGLFETNEVSEPAEAREPIAWVTDDDRAITAAQKQRALADGGATASSVRPYSIPCYAVSAAADAGEAVGSVTISKPGDSATGISFMSLNEHGRQTLGKGKHLLYTNAKSSTLTVGRQQTIGRAADTLEFHGLKTEATELRALLDSTQQEAKECACPNGDGSLRQPCPVHPPTRRPGGR